MDEFKNYFIGQRDGLEFALDMAIMQVRSIKNSINMINEKISKIEKEN